MKYAVQVQHRTCWTQRRWWHCRTMHGAGESRVKSWSAVCTSRTHRVGDVHWTECTAVDHRQPLEHVWCSRCPLHQRRVIQCRRHTVRPTWRAVCTRFCHVARLHERLLQKGRMTKERTTAVMPESLAFFVLSRGTFARYPRDSTKLPAKQATLPLMGCRWLHLKLQLGQVIASVVWTWLLHRMHYRNLMLTSAIGVAVHCIPETVVLIEMFVWSCTFTVSFC